MPKPTYKTAKEIIAICREGVAEGINEAASALLDAALLDVPYDTGALARSGDHTTASPEHLVAEVYFDKIYAAAQHEGEMFYQRDDGTIVHWVVRNRPAGGKSKYLEHPLYNLIPHFDRYIAEAVRRKLEGQGA